MGAAGGATASLVLTPPSPDHRREAGPSTLLAGTRIAAYWSQQYRCLYPGTVVRGETRPQDLTAPHFSACQPGSFGSKKASSDELKH